MPSNRVKFLGCPVDNLSIPAAITKLEDFIREGVPRYVSVINANKLWRMEGDPNVAQAILGASLFVPEKAIVIGCQMLGLNVKHHVGGIMLLKAFLPRAEEKGYKLYFLGAKEEVLQALVHNLQSRHPRLRIVGWHHGYLTAAGDLAVREQIQALRPDALFVALGTPKQEFWIAEHSANLGVPVCMGVGGSFDVLAGIKQDAPEWVRTIAMEWLYRLVQDPANLWKRYLVTMPWLAKRVLSARIGKDLPSVDARQS